jgi:hypothetical protein
MTATVTVPLRSRYARGCRALQDTRGRCYFSRRKLTDAPVRSDDMLHTVRQGETMMGIAWTMYRDPQKWWIIADYAIQDGHRVLFPDRDMTAGMVLRMPSPEQVEKLLATRGE